jgi:hypothetical protein
MALFAARTGRARDHRRRRGLSSRRLALIASALPVLASTGGGCSGDGTSPERLADGSRATAPRVELRVASDGPIRTSVLVRDAADVEPGSRLAACLRSRLPARPSGALVERVTVDGATVTFRDRSRRWLHACDDVVPLDDRAWCSGASGRLFDGRLLDPRLSVAGCATPEGDPVAFAWVEPGADARYVVVRRDGWAEVYEIAAGLPIRVAASGGIVAEEARATFEVSEHDVRGTPLRSYVLDASVAG